MCSPKYTFQVVVSELPIVHSVYGKENSSPVFFIGGSTMAGKGISSPSYPELFSQATGLTVSVYTKFLIKLRDVINIVESTDVSRARVYINCGGGDQQRVLNSSLAKLLPAHWTLPAHMEAPLRYSVQSGKRLRQKSTLLTKYVVKYVAKIFGLYPNTTRLETFRAELQQLALIAYKRSLTIYWIDTAMGDFRIPPFIRRERAMYCRILVQECLRDFPAGSIFLHFDEGFDSSAFLDDGFHLNSLGHKKLCAILQETYYSKIENPES